VGDGQPGPVAMGLRARLVDIQRGRAEDRYGWVHRVL
jgi:branched-chain amino acid aminotransferase